MAALLLAVAFCCAPARASDLDRSDADFSTAITNWGDGKSLDNYSLLMDALEIRQRELSPNDPRIAEVEERLGAYYYNVNDYRDAEDQFGKGLAVDLAAFGENDLHSAFLMGDLAAAYREDGRLGDAEKYVKRSLAIRRKLLPPTDIVIAGNLNNLGRLYLAERKYAEARDALQEALFISQSLDPPSETMVQEQKRVLYAIDQIEAAYNRLAQILPYAVFAILASLAISVHSTIVMEKSARASANTSYNPPEHQGLWLALGFVALFTLAAASTLLFARFMDWMVVDYWPRLALGHEDVRAFVRLLGILGGAVLVALRHLLANTARARAGLPKQPFNLRTIQRENTGRA